MDASVDERRRSRTSPSPGGPAEATTSTSADLASLAGVRENLSEAIRILLLRRWFFLVPFCLGTVLGTTASHYLPRTYTASTTFERVDDDIMQNLPIRGGIGSFLPFRERINRDIVAPEIMDEVVTELGLTDHLPRDPQGTLTPESERRQRQIGARLAAGVSIGFVSSSDHKDTLKLIYNGPDVAVAAPLLDGIREAYIRRTRAGIHQKLETNKAYFEEEARQRRELLEQLEHEKVMREIHSPTLDPTNPDLIFIKLTSLKNEERELERKQEVLQSKVLKTRQYVESIRATATSNLGMALSFESLAAKSPRVQEIEAELARIDAEIEDLQIKRQMTDHHPEIVERRELRQRYLELLTANADPFLTVPNAGLALQGPPAPREFLGEVWQAEKLRTEMDLVSYEDELERTGGARRAAQDEIQALEQARDDVPDARRAYRELHEQLGQVRNDYTLYAQTAQQYTLLLEANAGGRGTRFQCLAPAVADSRPTNPKSKSVLVLALLIGTGAGVVFVLLAELFDRSFHTTKQVIQSLSVNILESIDEIITSADRARRFRRRFIFAPALTVVLLGAVGVGLSMAYLSLEQPRTYERLMEKPRTLWSRVIENVVVTQLPDDPLAVLSNELASVTGAR